MGYEVISVAIIGCGRIAGHHCSSINNKKGLKLVAVCDLIPDKAKFYGEQYNIPYYQNYHKMFNELNNIDLVVLCTPSGMHYEHSKDIILNYKKNIVVEKPTFMNPKQLIEINQLALKYKIKYFPVFQNRYNKAVQYVKKAIDNKVLGIINLINIQVRWHRPLRYYNLAKWRGTYSHDGGALTNQGIHHIDLLRYFGGELDKVNCTMKTFNLDIEVENAVISTFLFKSGAMGSLEITTAAYPDDFEASISIVGSKGLAKIGGLAVNELQIFSPNNVICEEMSEDFSTCPYGFGHDLLYVDIKNALRNKASNTISFEDCLNTINLLNAFYFSDETTNWVQLDTLINSSILGRNDESISNLYRSFK